LQNFGSDMVVNGDFDADTNWTKGTGWTISSNVASSDGTQTGDSILTPSSALTAVVDTVYKIIYDVTARTAGSIDINFGGATTTTKSAVGRYSENVTATTAATLNVVADIDFVGSIDNVIVEELTTATQQTQKREHTWDDTAVTESYRIDDVEQSYTPARPSPTVTLKCNELPMIGYQDDITRHRDALRIRTVTDSIAESQALDATYYGENHYLTDGTDTLTDGSANTLYKKP